MLRDAGKEVVLSTQVLIESGADAATLHSITANGDFIVEANDMGAVQAWPGSVPFVAGPHLNIYNPPTLQWMAGLGASRWVMPLEMGHERPGPDAGRPPARPADRGVCLSAACRWRFRPAASRRATTTCPRTTASSAASSTPTA